MDDFTDRIALLRDDVLDEIEAVIKKHMHTDADMGLVIVFTPREAKSEEERHMACMANIPRQLIPDMLIRAMAQVAEGLPDALRDKRLDS